MLVKIFCNNSLRGNLKAIRKHSAYLDKRKIHFLAEISSMDLSAYTPKRSGC